MKRLTLLICILTILAFTSPKTHASPVTFDSRIDAAMMVFYRLLVQNTGSFPIYIEILPGYDHGDDGRVGGDADDYANGRDGGTGEEEIDTNGGKEKLGDLYNAGSAYFDPRRSAC